MKEAMYYKKVQDDRVLCFLCPHNCNISEGRRGACLVRENKRGTLYTLNYNRVSSIAVDPIEKKPLYHFYPGLNILSAGSVGCNLKCSFCQNWQIVQKEAPTEEVTPEELINMALNQKDNIGIAYTYNEPSIWFEYIWECSRLANKSGLKNVLVTNGFISEEPLKNLLPYIDAMNIDIKAFTEGFYKNVCKGILEPVKRTIEAAYSECHLEITTLVIPGLNDSLEEIRDIAMWMSALDRDIPLHLSRYFPNYKLSNNPTPIETLVSAKQEAEKYLNYVYLGNLWGHDTSTYCPKCKTAVIRRDGIISTSGIYDGKCKTCGERINVIY